MQLATGATVLTPLLPDVWAAAHLAAIRADLVAGGQGR